MDESAYKQLVAEIIGKYVQAKDVLPNPELLPKLEEWIRYFEKQKEPFQNPAFAVLH
jgi:hypothetical protein